MPLVKDEQRAVANFAAAAGELIRTWGWQNPRTERPDNNAYYHFLSVKGELTSGFLCEFYGVGACVVGDINDCGRLAHVNAILYKPMHPSEVANEN